MSRLLIYLYMDRKFSFSYSFDDRLEMLVEKNESKLFCSTNIEGE